MRPGSLALLSPALTAFLVVFAAASAHAEPSWYKRKKEVETEKAEVEKAKAAEKPAIGPGSQGGPDTLTPISQAPPKDLRTDFLFMKEGATESFSLDYGKINQTELGGMAPSLQYSFGWWWKPNLTLSASAKAAGIFSETFVEMFIILGPQLRYFFNPHFALSVMPGFGVTQGLSRVPQTNIPRPPDSAALGARRGLTAQAQASWFFWPKRGYAIAPTLTFMTGTQSERRFTAIALGITYQSGRPAYEGNVTSEW